MKECPLFQNTDKNELIKRFQAKDKVILHQRDIIDGLMKENKTYREHYWKCREEQDKDYWGR